MIDNTYRIWKKEGQLGASESEKGEKNMENQVTGAVKKKEPTAVPTNGKWNGKEELKRRCERHEKVEQKEKNKTEFPFL
ncbi:hypothetical protein RUM43_009877 [Polyplax serrata]|uniref:Uncharacterized protein n=1 Tax=Polyplax serrata TaxID=468196 RepID=A0AAN8S4I7_POLSC